MKTRRRALVVGVVGVCAAALVWVFRGDPAGEGLVGNANVLGGIAGAAAVVVALLAWRPRATSLDGSAEQRFRAAASYLAIETLRYWQGQAKDRRITTPSPAIVRWSWASPDVAPPAEQIRPELLTAGVVTRLRQQLYRDLPDEGSRIVILGGPGAGKTTAMMLLLIDVLENRPAGSTGPVPVWLTLGGWNTRTDLLDWAAEVLARDYPSLVTEEYGGPATPAELIRTGRIALFLDGLDEMPESERGPALDAIDRATTGLRVVLTSRPDEYRDATHLHRLWDAAVIDVLPVDIDHACDFLLHQQTGQRRESWEQVTEHLRSHPGGVASRTLTSPLALSLARDTYTHTTAAPTGLLAFRSPDALMHHLLTRLLALAYPDRDEHDYALRWLTWIAHHLDGRPDIHWWDIPNWMAGSQERLRRDTVVVIGVATALGAALVVGVTSGIFLGAGQGLVFGLVAALLAGTVSGFFAGSSAGAEPKAFAMRRPHPRRRAATTRTGLASRLLFGLAAGFGNGLVDGLLVGGGIGLASGILSGLATGLAAGLVDGFEAGLSIGFSVGLGVGLGIGLMTGITVAIVFGLVAGTGPAQDLAVMEIAWTARGTRVHFIPLLQTALHRQVLRQTGATYQFRHAALQDLLTRRPATAEAGEGAVSPPLR